MKTRKFNNHYNVIGKNIKKYRMLCNLSQRDLSNKLSLIGVTIHHSDISDIENFKHNVKDFEIIAFCKVLNVTRDQLFEGTDNLFD